jgi:hypothetical protein
MYTKEMKFITEYTGSPHVYRAFRISQHSPSHDQDGQPWVSVMPSVAVRRGGGHGLFADRNFTKGEIVGKYVGRILGKVDDTENQKYVDRLSHAEHDKIVVINGLFVDGNQPPQSIQDQKRRFGRVVYQPREWPGAYIHMANDSYRTGLETNCIMDQDGYLRTTTFVPFYDRDKEHEENVASELLWSYGHDYWAARRGRSQPDTEIVLPSGKKRVYTSENVKKISGIQALFRAKIAAKNAMKSKMKSVPRNSWQRFYLPQPRAPRLYDTIHNAMVHAYSLPYDELVKKAEETSISGGQIAKVYELAVKRRKPIRPPPSVRVRIPWIDTKQYLKNHGVSFHIDKCTTALENFIVMYVLPKIPLYIARFSAKYVSNILAGKKMPDFEKDLSHRFQQKQVPHNLIDAQRGYIDLFGIDGTKNVSENGNRFFSEPEEIVSRKETKKHVNRLFHVIDSVMDMGAGVLGRHFHKRKRDPMTAENVLDMHPNLRAIKMYTLPILTAIILRHTDAGSRWAMDGLPRKELMKISRGQVEASQQLANSLKYAKTTQFLTRLTNNTNSMCNSSKTCNNSNTNSNNNDSGTSRVRRVTKVKPRLASPFPLEVLQRRAANELEKERKHRQWQEHRHRGEKEINRVQPFTYYPRYYGTLTTP